MPQKNWLSTKLDASLAWAKKTACTVWQSAQSFLAKPAAQALLVRIKQLNLGSIKRFVSKYKWRLIALLILIYAGS